LKGGSHAFSSPYLQNRYNQLSNPTARYFYALAFYYPWQFRNDDSRVTLTDPFLASEQPNQKRLYSYGKICGGFAIEASGKCLRLNIFTYSLSVYSHQRFHKSIAFKQLSKGVNIIIAGSFNVTHQANAAAFELS
jgi:hypothetical protein